MSLHLHRPPITERLAELRSPRTDRRGDLPACNRLIAQHPAWRSAPALPPDTSCRARRRLGGEPMNSTMLRAGVEDGPVLSTDAADRSRLTAELSTTTCTDEPTLSPPPPLGVAGIRIADELLEWPADLFALTDGAARIAQTPTGSCPPRPTGGGGRQAASAPQSRRPGRPAASRTGPTQSRPPHGSGASRREGPHPSLPSSVGRGMVGSAGAGLDAARATRAGPGLARL